MLTLTPPDEMLGAIPDPQTLRLQIGARAAELNLLRRLLRVAEGKVRIQARAANNVLIPTVTAGQEAAHAGR